MHVPPDMLTTLSRYFNRLSPTSAMERSNIFIQTTPTLHQPNPPPQPSQSYSPTTSNPFPSHTPQEIFHRNERQTFRRLPQSNAILFTVHTYMKPITSLSDNELTEFVMQMKGWPAETARYKGRDAWGESVETYWARRCGEPGR